MYFVPTFVLNRVSNSTPNLINYVRFVTLVRTVYHSRIFTIAVVIIPRSPPLLQHRLTFPVSVEGRP